MKNIEEITIRPVTEADAEKLLSIYAPYVTAMPMPPHFIPEGRISGLRKQRFIWNAGCVGAVSAGCCMKGWRKR